MTPSEPTAKHAGRALWPPRQAGRRRKTKLPLNTQARGIRIETGSPLSAEGKGSALLKGSVSFDWTTGHTLSQGRRCRSPGWLTKVILSAWLPKETRTSGTSFADDAPVGKGPFGAAAAASRRTERSIPAQRKRIATRGFIPRYFQSPRLSLPTLAGPLTTSPVALHETHAARQVAASLS